MDYESKIRQGRFELLDPLAGTSLNDSERRHVRASMQNADLVVEMITRLVDDFGALAAALHSSGKKLVGKLQQLNTTSEREVWLSESTDIADLERRMRGSEQQKQSLAAWPYSNT